MKKMLFAILTVGTMIPAAASAQDVPLGTPVDTARMSVRGVTPATRERILELRQRADEVRARAVPRMRALERSVEPRVRVLERSVQPRMREAQRQMLVERARRADEVRRLAPQMAERRMLLEREVDGVRRAMPLRSPAMNNLSEKQREKIREIQKDHAEKMRKLNEDMQKKMREVIDDN
jgi:hypothetical protein